MASPCRLQILLWGEGRREMWMDRGVPNFSVCSPSLPIWNFKQFVRFSHLLLTAAPWTHNLESHWICWREGGDVSLPVRLLHCTSATLLSLFATYVWNCPVCWTPGLLHVTLSQLCCQSVSPFLINCFPPVTWNVQLVYHHLGPLPSLLFS